MCRLQILKLLKPYGFFACHLLLGTPEALNAEVGVQDAPRRRKNDEVVVLVVASRHWAIYIYITYIPGIYCLQGDYKIPTTYYQNENNPMSGGAKFGGLFVIFFVRLP